MNNAVPPGDQEQMQRRTGLIAGAISMVFAGLVCLSVVGFSGPAAAVFKASFLAALFAAFTVTVAIRAKRRGLAGEAVAEAALPSRDELERLLLQVAAENDGYVTPEAVVMRAKGLTLKAARELLDDLAVAGSCEVDSDEEGHLHYRFRTSVGPAREDHSPEAWLARESRRMAGDGASADTRLDA